MAGPSSWETVTHKKKATSNDKRAARKAFLENATVVEEYVPIEETETGFSTAFQKKKQQNSNSKIIKETGPVKSSQQKKKKDGKQKPEKINNLEDALKQVTVEELEAQWNDVKTRCKSAPSLWLGDIVGFLSRKLDVKESQPPFTTEAPDYPCSIVNPKLASFLSSTLKSYEPKMLKEFFDYCLKEMLSDLNKGQPVHAYRIYLQLLVKNDPTFIINSLKQFLGLIKKRQNERLPCLALLWTCNLAGLQSPITALQVWGQIMLPMMSHKMIAPYAVQTLERILSCKLDKQKANAVFGPNEFFPLMDVIFTSNVSLPPNLQKTLLKLYPKLKTIAYGPDPSTSLRKFFPSYLTRITQECPDNYKTELLEGLLYCLATDHLCLSGWRQMYDTHMAQSGILLKHMVKTWSSTSSKLPQAPFQETIHAFSLTNEELAQSQGGKKNFEDCRKSCKFLLEQMEKKRFPWRSAAFGVFFVLLAAFIMDLFLHKGFTYSLTHQCMQRTGLVHILKQAWSKITLYGGIALSWLVTNVPLYYAKMCELCGPYLKLFVQKLQWMGMKILDFLQPAIVWINTKAPIVLQWIQTKAPIALAAIQNNLTVIWVYVSSTVHSGWVVISPYAMEAWDAISFYTIIFWQSVEPSLSSAWFWLKTSVGTT